MGETPDPRLSGFMMSLAIWGAAIEGRYDGLVANVCEDRGDGHRYDSRWWDQTAADLRLHASDGSHRGRLPEWYALAGHQASWWDRQLV
jgi:hypothetical protein